MKQVLAEEDGETEAARGKGAEDQAGEKKEGREERKGKAGTKRLPELAVCGPIIEELMLDIMFELPENGAGRRYVVTPEVVMGHAKLFPVGEAKAKSA